MTTASIDFEAIRRTAPLRQILADDCKGERHGRFCCALHDDRDAALEHYPASASWYCFSCNQGGDVFDWLRLSRGMTAAEVQERYGQGLALDPMAPRPGREDRPRVERPEAHRDPELQSAYAFFIEECEGSLRGPDGREALAYLTERRGLTRRTLDTYRIGFNPRARSLGAFDVLADRQNGPEVFAARGIVIPLIARGSWFDTLSHPSGPRWQGAVIRRQADTFDAPLRPGPDGKKPSRYLGLKGTTRHEMYPYPDIDPAEARTPGIESEGEIDALTIAQAAWDLGFVATFGGAGSRPSDHALARLRQCPSLLVCTDNFDRRGLEALDRWREWCPGLVKRGLLPFGKDVNEFHSKGGNVHQWLVGEFARHGLETRRGDAYEGDLPPDLPKLI